jgi:hypothetical protein
MDRELFIARETAERLLPTGKRAALAFGLAYLAAAALGPVVGTLAALLIALPVTVILSMYLGKRIWACVLRAVAHESRWWAHVSRPRFAAIVQIVVLAGMLAIYGQICRRLA